MAIPFEEACCASLPHAALSALAELRCRQDVQVSLAGERAWVRWNGDCAAIIQRLLPVAGARFFGQRDGDWFELGHFLPCTAEPPSDHPARLDRVLIPEILRSQQPEPLTIEPVPMRLVRDDRYRPATALLGQIVDLAAWADSATTRQLESLSAARFESQCLVVGDRLPALPRSTKLWGRTILMPLGLRIDPALPESALLDVLGAAKEDLVIWRKETTEFVKRSVLRPISRAALRLAVRELS